MLVIALGALFVYAMRDDPRDPYAVCKTLWWYDRGCKAEILSERLRNM